MAMDTYVQTLIDPDFDTFNLLASYQHGSLSKDVYSYDNRPSFDLSLTEQSLLGLDPGTPEGLSARTFQMPGHLSSAWFPPASVDLESVPVEQNSSLLVPSPLSDQGSAGGASPWSQFEKNTRKINASAIKRWQEKTAIVIPASAKPKDKPAKLARERRRQLSSTTQSSQKELSLEKNRLAAAKCRVKKREENERMLEEARALAKANKDLRDLVRTMKIEMHTLATIFLAHSNGSCCKKPEQLGQGLEVFQEAGPLESGRVEDLDDDLFLTAMDCPALSASDTGRSSVSNSHSPVQSSPSTISIPRFSAFLVGDGEVESPTYRGILEI